MLYEFIITIKNAKTGEETTHRTHSRITEGYFEAWNNAINTGKKILEESNDKYLFIKSIENL